MVEPDQDHTAWMASGCLVVQTPEVAREVTFLGSLHGARAPPWPELQPRWPKLSPHLAASPSRPGPGTSAAASTLAFCQFGKEASNAFHDDTPRADAIIHSTAPFTHDTRSCRSTVTHPFESAPVLTTTPSPPTHPPSTAALRQHAAHHVALRLGPGFAVRLAGGSGRSVSQKLARLADHWQEL